MFPFLVQIRPICTSSGVKKKDKVQLHSLSLTYCLALRWIKEETTLCGAIWRYFRTWVLHPCTKEAHIPQVFKWFIYYTYNIIHLFAQLSAFQPSDLIVVSEIKHISQGRCYMKHLFIFRYLAVFVRVWLQRVKLVNCVKLKRIKTINLNE